MNLDIVLALIRTTFLAADNRLRATWRALLYVPVYLLLFGTLFRLLLGLAERAGLARGMEQSYLLFALTSCVVQLGIVKLMLSALDRRVFATLGLWFYRGWWKELAVGAALGALMLSLVVGVEAAFGAVRFSWGSETRHGLIGLSLNSVMFVTGALKEELELRGYPFQRGVEAIGSWPAIVVCSTLFGVLHWWNPASTVLSTANTVLIGVLLALAYLKTRALWLPIGLHFSWNFFLGCVFSLPVSGIVLEYRLLQTEVRGPAYLTGGDYGPEGSVVTTVVIVAAVLWLARTKKISVSQPMTEILK